MKDIPVVHYDYPEDEEMKWACRHGMITALAQFFHYLLTLDDYTLGIVGRMSVRWHEGKAVDISELSREHGCSRQAMHRKILSVIAKHPELSSMLGELLPKLSRSRRQYLLKRSSAVNS